MKVIWIICQVLFLVSLAYGRHTKNLDLTKAEPEHEDTPKFTAPYYDSPENCKGDNMEWLVNGPVCDVYCDHQPVNPPRDPHHKCSARMYDVIHDIINDAEEDPATVFKNGVIDLDRIAVNVTTNMRKWESARLHQHESSSNQHEGCYCKDGFARLGEDCIPISHCPPREQISPSECRAENFEEWKEDGPGCDVFCPGVSLRKFRSLYSARHLTRCEGDVLRTLQEFEPSVTDLASEITKEVLSKYGDIVTQKLRTSHAAVKKAGVKVGGCYCMDGYMRYGDVCVKPDQCPSPDQKDVKVPICQMPHEEFHKVSDHCEVYCDIQPTKYGRSGTSINSCGRTGEYLRGFLPTVTEYKNAFDTPTVVAKYAENITESIRSANKQTFSDGCYCKPGFARYGYRCIRLDQCPMRKCHKWEVFQIAGPICEATCANLQYHHSILVQGPDHSMPGCFCPAGQVRDDRGICVDPVICWNYHKQPTRDTIYVNEEEPVKESVKPEVVVVVDPEALKKKTETIVPPATLESNEKPIYNRRILESEATTKEELPVVDGFKKETVPIVEPVPKKDEVPVVPVQEKVVVVEEMTVPVVAIYDKP